VHLTEVTRRIRAEFLEMPTLRLNATQASDAFQLDPLTCEAVLNALVDTRFLVRTRDGCYVRAGTIPPIDRPGAHRHSLD
jgi:hypothetical protein